MKYIINEDSIVVNVVVGMPTIPEGYTSIEKDRGFGRIGDYYDSVNDECRPVSKEWQNLDKETGNYVYDESKLDSAKQSIINKIKMLCDEHDKNDFEYPEGSGNMYKITDAVINTLQRGADLSNTDPIPCNGGAWDTVDGVSVTMTMGNLKSMFNYGYDIPSSNYTNMKNHIVNINNMKTVKDVVDYDFSTGWK